MAKTKEYTSYAEIGAYLHRNDSEAYVKSYTSVNKPLAVDASKDTQQISKLRVSMHVEEDTSVQPDGGFYTKSVGMSQERDSKRSSNDSSDRSTPPSRTQENDKGELTPLKVVKNMVDNILEDNRQARALLFVTLIIATAAFAIAVLM